MEAPWYSVIIQVQKQKDLSRRKVRGIKGGSTLTHLLLINSKVWMVGSFQELRLSKSRLNNLGKHFSHSEARCSFTYFIQFSIYYCKHVFKSFHYFSLFNIY